MENRLSRLNCSSVSGIAVIHLADQLIQQGIISRSWLHTHQPSTANALKTLGKSVPVQASLAELRLPEQSIIELWRAADEFSYDAIGFDIGSNLDLRTRGILVNWISHSVNLDQAFERFRNHIALLNPSEFWSATEQGEVNLYTFCFTNPERYPRAALERSMVAALTWANYLTGKQVKVKYCKFQFEEPAYSVRYRDFFGQNVLFNQANNVIAIDKAEMNAPLVNANPVVEKLVETRVVELMKSLATYHPFIESVNKLLVGNLTKFKHASALSEHLNMSRATLFRKLKSHGVTLQELLEATRKLQYESAKNQGISTQEITQILGYSEPSALYKAVKRWKTDK